MTLANFLTQVVTHPTQINFNDTIAMIDANYQFTPSAFQNGELCNEAGQNSGSCKVFSFASAHHLTEAQTLQCFGDYYRVDVLQNPAASDHQNIRNFMQFGWKGITFSNVALTPVSDEARISHYKATQHSSPEKHAEFTDWLSAQTVSGLMSAQGNAENIQHVVMNYLQYATAAGLAIDEIENILGVNEPSIMDLAELSETDEETVINTFEKFTDN